MGHVTCLTSYPYLILTMLDFLGHFYLPYLFNYLCNWPFSYCLSPPAHFHAYPPFCLLRFTYLRLLTDYLYIFKKWVKVCHYIHKFGWHTMKYYFCTNFVIFGVHLGTWAHFEVFKIAYLCLLIVHRMKLRCISAK